MAGSEDGPSPSYLTRARLDWPAYSDGEGLKEYGTGPRNRQCVYSAGKDGREDEAAIRTFQR